MSIRILWRSTVFLATLVLIYFAFPILIVPSSLPAIKVLFIENEFPETQSSPTLTTSIDDLSLEVDTEIMEINIPQIPTFAEKIEFVKDLHQQGLAKIFKGENPPTID